MKIQRLLLSTAVAAAACAMSLNALACSTIVIGKDVSKTGNVIVGHNEDNGGRIMTSTYWVPAAEHAAGETIVYEPGSATIPQVPKTHGFYWSQTYAPNGSSFSDAFVNDQGVVIVSNNCNKIFPENKQQLNDGGIGYGIRRLLAERADSARHAVDIAADLLGKYGYRSEGRTYTIADPKEAWQIAIHQGNVWVARRVKDNEVVFIPNNFMMNKVDLTDKENVITSPGLVERAIEQGRYKPATPGVYNDFNFREAYQPRLRRAQEYNFTRNQIGWIKLTGQHYTDPDQFPYSATPDRKFGVEDVKDILRSHTKEDGAVPGWFHQLGLGICRPSSQESAVYVLDSDPMLIQAHRSFCRPCEVPYVPFFPLAKPAEGGSLLPAWQTALARQFKGEPQDFSYNPAWPIWTFVNHANTVDYLQNEVPANKVFLKDLETQMTADDANVKKTAQALKAISPEKAQAYLHNYNLQKFDQARTAVAAQTSKISPTQVMVLAEKINPESDAPVEIAILSNDGFDATKSDVNATRAGVNRAMNTKGNTTNLAKPVASRVADVNGDGKPDLVMQFKQKDVAFKMLPGAVFDVWVYSTNNDTPITGFDTALVEKK